MFDRNYEDHLQRALGNQKYQDLCQTFPNTGKPTRARLIALEDGLPIPELVGEMVRSRRKKRHCRKMRSDSGRRMNGVLKKIRGLSIAPHDPETFKRWLGQEDALLLIMRLSQAF